MDRSQSALANWLEGRKEYWKRIAVLVGRQRDQRDDDPDKVREIITGFKALARDLSMARNDLANTQVARYLEVLFAQAHETVYRKAHSPWRELLILYRDEIPALVSGRLRGAILATVAIFLGTLAVGWLLVSLNPELAGLFASETMINKVQQGELWTDDMLNVLPSSVLSLGILTNNIVVALTAFVLGALYGLGTLYIIALNGFMLGGIFAFTAQYDMDGRLFQFVVAHGIVELSVICLAGAAGMQLGEALIRPGPRTRVAAFQEVVAETSKLLFVIVPFLVGAGIIEGFISPDPRFPLLSRVVVGVCYGVLLWLVLTGKIWRKKPGSAGEV